MRFLFPVTLRRLDLAAEIYHVREPEKLPLVMSPDEMKRLGDIAAMIAMSHQHELRMLPLHQLTRAQRCLHLP